MTKEIYHEGWLIKSPPTKRIWRANWRRRWFTLKQGEIPEQFCLEYFKDRSCRKLKGVIDLDQCEQVDSGLQLEHRKQKFQYMFDVKTPHRTYYLAANSEEDMNAWVNCICEVCNLQDLSKPQQQNNENRQYYNVTSETTDSQGEANLSTLKTTTLSPVKSDQIALLPTAEPIDNNNSVYQNYDAMCRNSSYNNRETLICDAPLNKNSDKETKEDYYNFMAIANTLKRSQKSDEARNNKIKDDSEPSSERRMVANQSAYRKIPENLKLNSGVSDLTSPQTSSSSGPYIAISDCISGNPLIDRDNPTTPLNSLDPKFYDTPRSHFNIGLNLTNEQPYSPKRNNILSIPPQTPQSGKSTPTDSESVFTDDEEWTTNPNDSMIRGRLMRPSESSVENDSIVFTYAQRFSKMPELESVPVKKVNQKRPITTAVAGLSLEKNDTEEQNKDVNSSDTENASPAIAYGPKDMNSYVDENYDIPRSHQLPYTKLGEVRDDENAIGLGASGTSASMLELDENRSGKMASPSASTKFESSTMPKKRSHFYTNAAPSKVEGHFFRYDFDEKQSDAPAIYRNLKPKPQHDNSEKSTTSKSKPVPQPNQPDVPPKPPSIDRKLKPTTPNKPDTSSLNRRSALPAASECCVYNNEQISKTLPRNYNNSASLTSTNSTPAPVTTQGATGQRQAGVLEYFDLDHSNPPPICNNSSTSASTSNLNVQSSASGWQPNLSHRLSAVSISSSTVFGAQNDANTGSSLLGSTATNATIPNTPTVSGVVYKKVDFVKTEAFIRTRQDAEMARAKNRSKE